MDTAKTGRKNNTIYYILWAVFSWVLYENTLFRCLGDHSPGESRLILFAMILLLCVPEILLGERKERSGADTIINLLAGLIIYTAMTFLSIRENVVLVIFLAAAAFTFIYALFILCSRIKRRRKKMLIRRIVIVYRSIRNLFCTGASVIMVVIVIGIGIMPDSVSCIMSSSLPPAEQSGAEKQTIDGNLDTLSLLCDDRWKSLSVKRKLDVLQTVVNIDRCAMGIPHKIDVRAASLREGLEGYYRDSDHQIVVNMEGLGTRSPYELTETVLHETYHSFQHRVIDAYDETSDTMKSLMIFRNAPVFKREFANYNDGSEDYCTYYTQKCEETAREHAKTMADFYFQTIELHNREKGEGT